MRKERNIKNRGKWHMLRLEREVRARPKGSAFKFLLQTFYFTLLLKRRSNLIIF